MTDRLKPVGMLDLLNSSILQAIEEISLDLCPNADKNDLRIMEEMN
tara:strand:- start:135 stop:272 length:138 start_codon:yes stop_codon:yes gene_type:complete